MSEQLRTLLAIADRLSGDSQAINAGDGSISVKNRERTTLLTKASGVSMSELSVKTGWTRLSLPRLRSLLTAGEFQTESPASAEEFFEAICSCAEELRGHIPLEATLHANLDAVVIRSPWIAANAIACHPDREAIIAEINHRREDHELTWAPCRETGAGMLFSFEQTIREYERTRSRRPATVVFENHGMFCSGPNAEQTLELHDYWIEQLVDYFGPIHPIDQQPPLDMQTKNLVERAITMACRTYDLQRPMIRCSEAPELLYATKNKSQEVFRSALSPDHVRFCGPRAVFAPRDCRERDILAQLRLFIQEFGELPRLIVVDSRGISITGYDPEEIDLTENAASAAIRSVLLAKTPLHGMDPRSVRFIFDWQKRACEAK